MKRSWFYLVLIFFLVMASNVLATKEPWTWAYTKVFSPEQMVANKTQTSLFFSKLNTPAFTQLIFSWNSFRPKRGYFIFKAQVRDAQTKRWYDWHKMVEWGTHVQRSFRHETLGTTYHHVRLELPRNKQADALRIKIEAHDGASLSKLQAIFVSISNLSKFKSEAKDQSLLQLPTAKVTGVPAQSQMVLHHTKKEVLCSPTSLTMVVSYLIQKPVDAVGFARKAHDDGLDAYGSWPFNTASAFEQVKGNYLFRVQRLASFADLHQLLKRKIPVVVSVRGNIEGAAKEYDQGHLLVVVGWDKERKKVLCHDPAFDANSKVPVAYDLRSFLTAWERSRRLAYCASSIPS
jgi:Peptidase_C39 like family